MENTKTINTTCCIAGGGPAGIMLGFLLARAGIEVIVLEKHKDFFRDFRGDTIHPSTFQLMHELGLLDEFVKVPHQEVSKLVAIFNGHKINMVDFSHLKVVKPAMGLMPQWDFLNFMTAQAKKYKAFTLLTETKATDLIVENNVVKGVKATTSEGEVEIRATMTVGTDGRSSTIREKASFKVVDTGAPIDVLWFRLSRKPSDEEQTFGNFYFGQLLIMLNRDEYWQCAYVINKGAFQNLQEEGLPAFRKKLSNISPFLSNRPEELKSWDDVKLLSVSIDHLETWYRPGLICIGDAAHAMSPVGGVGINLAIQDAVATANALYHPLNKGQTVPLSVLKGIQKRRTLPTRLIQQLQVKIQNGIIYRRKELANTTPPFFMRMINTFPILRRIPAWLVGIGIRPEHIRTPEVNK